MMSNAIKDLSESYSSPIDFEMEWHNSRSDRWYQSHALAGSVGPTPEDSYAHKRVDCGDLKGGLKFHGIPHRLGKHVRIYL